jgi:hypothetical protein
MEVEFLSNMKYNLFTSEAEWKEWHILLGKFGRFFDAALRRHYDSNNGRGLGPLTPVVQLPPALPSPPPSNFASPPFPATGSISPARSQFSTTTPLALAQANPSAVSPIRQLPEPDPLLNSRKRSIEDQYEPPPKRQTLPYPQNTSQPAPYGSLPSVAPLSRMTLPALSIPVTQNLEVPQQLVPQLPVPGSKAMSLVFTPPTQWPQSSSASTPISASTQNTLPFTNPLMHDPQRQLSPLPVGSANSSPIGSAFQGQNQNRLSPSHFLQQRQSPYRPVRRVQTLLYPPPSTSMYAPARNITLDQMQYQPLSKSMSERRMGAVPYMHYEAWPQTNQFNQWPVLPPPNFSRAG